MLVIGLTGSIGTGKSTTAKMFARRGLRVCDSDAIVHKLYARGGAAVERLDKEFPGVVVDGAVDRAKLGAAVLGDTDKLARLEAIVHPLVRAEEREVLAAAYDDHDRAIILEIPLLFETGATSFCDIVIVTTARPEVQRERVMAREGMSEDKFKAILNRQMSDAEKRRRAHFIVDTSHGMEAADNQVGDIMATIAAMPGRGRHAILSQWEAMDA